MLLDDEELADELLGDELDDEELEDELDDGLLEDELLELDDELLAEVVETAAERMFAPLCRKKFL